MGATTLKLPEETRLKAPTLSKKLSSRVNEGTSITKVAVIGNSVAMIWSRLDYQSYLAHNLQKVTAYDKDIENLKIKLVAEINKNLAICTKNSFNEEIETYHRDGVKNLQNMFDKDLIEAFRRS